MPQEMTSETGGTWVAAIMFYSLRSGRRALRRPSTAVIEETSSGSGRRSSWRNDCGSGFKTSTSKPVLPRVVASAMFSSPPKSTADSRSTASIFGQAGHVISCRYAPGQTAPIVHTAISIEQFATSARIAPSTTTSSSIAQPIHAWPGIARWPQPAATRSARCTHQPDAPDWAIGK